MFFWNSCFFDDPTDVGNLISDSSAFSKSSLNIWKFSVHVLLKPCLENFEHYFASMWNKCNCAVVWTFFGIAFLWDWNETDLSQSCGHCWIFQIYQHIVWSILTGSSFMIWNSSAGIPSLPLALFVVIWCPYDKEKYMIKISIQYDKEAHLIKEAYCLHLEVSAYQTGLGRVRATKELLWWLRR